MEGVLRELKPGAWAIEYSSTRWSEPVRDTECWAINRAVRIRPFENGEPVTYHSNGVWMARGGLELHVDPKAKPVKSISEPVPMPKLRKGSEARWKNGIWETRTPKTGWR